MTHIDEPFDLSDPFEFGKRGDRARAGGARVRGGIYREEAPPTATVFGAGIAGLTVAHELVERGFYVQVVEPVQSQEQDDACEVGGLARSQPARFRQFHRVHWPPNWPELDDNDVKLLMSLRDRKLQRVQRRFGFPERISLPPPTTPWPLDISGADYLDQQSPSSKRELLLWIFGGPRDAPEEEQVANLVVLLDPYARVEPPHADPKAWDRIYRMVERLLTALVHYRRDVAGELELLYQDDRKKHSFKIKEVLHRETLLVEVGVQCEFFEDRRINASVSKIWADALKEAIGLLFLALTEADESGDGRRFVERVKRRLGREEDKSFVHLKRRYDELREEDERNLKSFKHAEIGKLADDVRNFRKHLEAVQIVDMTERNRAQADFITPPRNCVMLKVVEYVVMGEHGFRYFPAFYRHLFETMRRTPILDENGYETNRTTFDELIPAPPTAVGIAGVGAYREFSLAKPSSVVDLRDNLNWISKALEFSERDQLRYQTQLLKFMTSCTERREMYESLSWLEFVDGRSEYDKADPEGARERNGFSKKGAELICDIPQMLVAMSAEETDARTNGQVSIQQTLSRDGPQRDAFLNGPTSTAWLQHWKRYLKRQGVRFFTGRLHSIWKTESGLEAHAVGPSDWQHVPDGPFPLDLPRPEEHPEEEYADPFAQMFVTATEMKGPFDSEEEAKAYQEVLQKRERTEWDHCKVCERHGSEVRERYWVRRRNQKRSQSTPQVGPHYYVLAVPYEAATGILWNIDGLYELKTLLEPCRDALSPDKIKKVDPDKIKEDFDRVKEIIERYDELCSFKNVEPFHGMDEVQREQMFERMRKDPQSMCKELNEFIRQADHARAPALQWLDGDLETLLDFDVEACRRDAQGNRRPPHRNEFCVERDARGLPYDQFHFPLRDLIGVQYYFRERTRIGRGNFILPRSEWGISGVGEVYIWRRREAQIQGIIGQLSVDIGNAYREYPLEAGRLQQTAWKCTPNELAQIAWSQILEAAGDEYADWVKDPRYYQIDDGLKYERKKDGRVLPAHNENMLMINLPGQWQKRPGLRFRDKGPRETGQRREIEYTVSNERWVMAGNHMPTHTRLSTMESANESARHAVNAILQHVNQWSSTDVFHPFMGDVCSIFNPEDFELRDLAPLKRLDKELWEQKIPHMLDVLGVLEAINRLPVRDDPKETPILNLARLIEIAADRQRRDWDFLKGYTGLGLANIDSVISQLKRLAGVSNEALDVILRNLKSNKNY